MAITSINVSPGDTALASQYNSVVTDLGNLDTLKAPKASPTFTTAVTVPQTAGVADYDKFVVLDGGVIKYRTGAEVLSDIGAGSADISDIKTAFASTEETAFLDWYDGEVSDYAIIAGDVKGVFVPAAQFTGNAVINAIRIKLKKLTGATGNIFVGVANVTSRKFLGGLMINLSDLKTTYNYLYIPIVPINESLISYGLYVFVNNAEGGTIFWASDGVNVNGQLGSNAWHSFVGNTGPKLNLSLYGIA